MYLIISGDGDGNPLTLVTDDINECLQDWTHIRRWEGLDWFKQNWDPNYWAEDVAILLEVEARVPQATVTEYRVDSA